MSNPQGTGTKAQRMGELEMRKAAQSKEYQADTLDQAIARCEEILRNRDLDAEQRAVAENQLATFRQMREEL